MGKQKKKFIDKKNSATFQLMARDSSDPNYTPGLPAGDRVFVRVDNNQNYTPESFFHGDDAGDPDSIFADAPGDEDGDYSDGGDVASGLPDRVRRENLELGFPDDGYNYLSHLREIKNAGGGSAYYQNPKASFEQLPHDVKAYDASRLEVPKSSDVSEEKSIYSVASKTVGVRLQKAMDPEVTALLDDSDSSKFGSDVEDLEEDFVVRANLLEGPVAEELDKQVSLAAASMVDHLQSWDSSASDAPMNATSVSALGSEKPRARRPLDEQFDLLALQEYADDSDEEFNGYVDEDYDNQESLTEKLNNAFKDHPSNLLHQDKETDDESPELAAEVIRRCREYAEKYENEDDDVEEVLVEESSDESEAWDCETIVSTYSTLDNHPGKIGAPEARRKKKLAETISTAAAGPNQVITLKGKEKLPVDFLPRSRIQDHEKTKDEKDVNDKRSDFLKRKPHSQESKEEKKERKNTVKLERREARQMKKEMKGLYKSEAHHAQKVAAFTGPSSIHLM